MLGESLSPPLGFGFYEPRRAVTTMVPGMQLVLYTDGLIERRDEDLKESLQSLVTRCGDPGIAPGALAQHLLDTAGRSHIGYDDEVAILTAYLRPDHG